MMQVPIAKRVSHVLEKHGHRRDDPYYWLKDRESEEVIQYLELENHYTQKQLKHTQDLQDKLFQEITARISEEDVSVPYLKDGYYYYHRFEQGREYPLYCRKEGSLDSEEQVMLDVNFLAEGKEYCDVRGLSLSSNNNLLAFSVDFIGRRNYSVYLKNLDTGETRPIGVENITGSITWANDNEHIFYVRKDPETLRSFQICRSSIGQGIQSETVVFQEDDDTFSCYIYKSKSKKYLVIGTSATLTDEYHYLNANSPLENFKVFHPRERGLEYSVSHAADSFYINTNWDAKNFKLMKTSEDKTGKEFWEEFIEHKEDVLLEGVTIFDAYMILSERQNGLEQLRVISFETAHEYIMEFNESVYSVGVSVNPEFNTSKVRLVYNSMITPYTIMEYDLVHKTKEVLKQQPVMGSYDVDAYINERIFATATDGAQVPVTIVYRKDTFSEGKNPLLVYGYGSYGSIIDPYFSYARISLLDRGFVYAIAHIRGSEIMGRLWYEDGKLLKKKNTFTDFIDCTKCLVEKKYGDPDKVFAMGGSAGGLLMGAILNLAPELFKGVIAAVPFVDVVTTMLDDTIPLTTGEYDEWGNPNDETYYHYMLSYSPYDNVEAKAYPNILVTTGLHDSQVQYWEPAKWVAKLRHMKTDQNMLLLHTNMEAGHSGATGRYKVYKETAMEYAFLLNLVK